MKKATRKQKLYVGGFFVAVFVLIAGAIFISNDSLTMFRDSSRYFAAFKNATGLNSGAPVKMGGVDIGTVESVNIQQVDGRNQIVAAIVIYSPYNRMIKNDAVISLETQGVLGDKFLMVQAGSNTEERLKDEQFIKVLDKPELQAMVAQSTDIVQSVKDATEKFAKFTDGLPSNNELKTMNQDIGIAIAQLRDMLVKVNSPKGVLSSVADPVTASNLRDTSTALKEAATHLASITKKVDEGRGSLGAFVNDTGLYDDVRSLFGRANRSKVLRYMIQKSVDEPGE
jgi:phospholipid/cholesterol/gamma-HCH transport system substrate-binding protein